MQKNFPQLHVHLFKCLKIIGDKSRGNDREAANTLLGQFSDKLRSHGLQPFGATQARLKRKTKTIVLDAGKPRYSICCFDYLVAVACLVRRGRSRHQLFVAAFAAVFDLEAICARSICFGYVPHWQTMVAEKHIVMPGRGGLDKLREGALVCLLVVKAGKNLVEIQIGSVQFCFFNRRDS